MSEELPFSQACENNKQPILEVLREVFSEPGLILEIGTGTGQHAVHFAAHMPHLLWQPSDHPDNGRLSAERIRRAELPNVRAPLLLDVAREPWPLERVDGVFSANTAHIMSWPEVEAMFRGVGARLKNSGLFCLYGPFNHDGQYSSDSNRRFDQYLKQQASRMGIRDLRDLEVLAGQSGLDLASDNEMPANNRLLVWRCRGLNPNPLRS